MMGSKFIIRVCSLLTLLGLSAALPFREDNGIPDAFATALFCACVTVSFTPGSATDRTVAKWAAILAAATLAGLSFCPGNFTRILIPTGSFLMIAYSVAEWLWRCRDIRSIFTRDIAWIYMEDISGFWCRAVIVFFGLITLLWPIPAAVLLCACYAISYYASYSARTIFIRAEWEDRIKEMIRSYPRMMPQLPEENERNMAKLFERIEKFMKERKPYLREDFTISDLSKEVYSNKTYVSRTINCFSGRNFKQFINWYRVEYATDLIKRDPRLSVSELATMSGFHSSVSLNMAFKLYCNESPGTYKRTIEEAKYLSTTGEEAR